jgi:hypothetical protein
MMCAAGPGRRQFDVTFGVFAAYGKYSGIV